MTELLPPASALDVLRGRAPLVGSRLDPLRPRGFISPVEARVLLGLAYGDLAEEEARYLDSVRGPGADAKLLVRVALARLGAQNEARAVERPVIVSAAVDNVTIPEAVDAIFAQHTSEPRATRSYMVHFVHPHALNLAAFDAEYRSLLRRADLVLPDGVGLRLAAKILGVGLRHNVNGTDLLPLLCARAAEAGRPLLLVGGAEGVAEACRENLLAHTPGLSIPFIHHGFLDEAALARVKAELRKHPGALLLVGMGSPLQERWAWANASDVPGLTVITVGGLFDFFSGRIARAPQEWRELGLEWLWRLKQEPTRLAKRYLLGNPLFLSLAVKQRLFGPRAGDTKER